MGTSTSFSYDELVAALGDWLEETSEQWTDNINKIISIGESRLATDLNFEIFDRVVGGILTPGQYVQAIKPSGWQGTRSLHLRDAGGPADVALLVDADGADGATTYTERSSNAFDATFVGDAQLDTAFPKFGTAALLLDGAGDYMEYADDPAFALGSADFTIEGWVRFTSLPAVGDEMTMVSQWSIGTGSDQAFAISLIQDGGDYRIRFEAEDTVGVFEQGGLGGAPALDTYFHFAAQRSGDTLSIWFDGTLEFEAGSIFSGAIQDSTETVKLGVYDPAGGGNAAFLDGHLDDVRISTIAQYATGGDITVPAAAFPTSGTATGLRRFVERRTYEYCQDFEPDETATAEPQYYAEYTETEFFMSPPPDQAYAFELRQIQTPEALAPGNQNTWLGDNAGDLLLYSCLLASDEFLISDPQDLATWRTSYGELVTARKLELRRQWRGDYSPVKEAARTVAIA